MMFFGQQRTEYTKVVLWDYDGAEKFQSRGDVVARVMS